MSHTSRLHYGRVDIGCLRQSRQICACVTPVSRACRKLSARREAFHGKAFAPALPRVARTRQEGRAQRCPVQTTAIFGLFRGDNAEKTRKKYQAEVDAINKLEPQMQNLSDEQLAQKTHELKQKAQSAGNVDALLVEAFAVSCSPASLLTYLVS